MELLLKKEIINKQFKIEPKNLLNYKNFLQDEVNNLKSKCLGDKYGIIYDIIKIISIHQDRVFTQNFIGGLIFNVSFEAFVLNPNIEDVIEMKIFQNKDIFLAKYGPLICIIVNGNMIENTDIGTTVSIKIILKEINYNSNIIKLVGEYIN